MPTLHVRNVPDALYQHIQKLAADEGRSLTAEVVQLLDHGLRARQVHRGAAAMLARIDKRTRRAELPRGWKVASALLHADRRR